MKTRSLLFFITSASFAVSVNAQEKQKLSAATFEAGKVTVEPKEKVAVNFISYDTLKLRAVAPSETPVKKKRKQRDERFVTYTIEDENCVRLACTVGHSKIELRHLDNLIIYERHGQIDLVSISNHSVIRLSDIRELSLTVDQ